MRHLLHFGLFAVVLAATAQASADDDSDDRRETRVVIARDHGPRHVRTVRVDTPPARVVYDSRRPYPPYRRATHDPRRDYQNQRQDLAQIRSIAKRWERAVSYGDYPRIRTADARLDAWLDREIRESTRDPYGDRYTQPLRAISDQLAYLEKRDGRGHAYGHGRGHAKGNAYGHSRGHGRGHAQGNFYFEEKSRIFDQLIRLSERQVQRARANFERPVMWSYGYR
jgi:hypothetical protein